MPTSRSARLVEDATAASRRRRARALRRLAGSPGRPSPGRRTGCRSRSRRRRRRRRHGRRRCQPGKPPVMYGTSSLRPWRRAQRARGTRLPSERHQARASPSSGRRPCRRGPTGSSAPSAPRSDARLADDPGERVRGLERGMIPSVAGQQLERVDDLGVGDRAGTRPGRSTRGTSAPARRPGSRARRRSTAPPDLAVLVLHQVAAHPVDDAGHAVGRPPRRRPARRRRGARRCRRSREKMPDRVRAAADAGDDDVGIAADERGGTARGPRRR